MKKSFFLLTLMGGLLSCTHEDVAPIVNSPVNFMLTGDNGTTDICVVCNYSPKPGKDVFMITTAQKVGNKWQCEDQFVWNEEMMHSRISFAAFSPASGRPGLVGVDAETFCMPMGDYDFDVLRFETAKAVGYHTDVMAAYAETVEAGEVVNLDFQPVLARYDFSVAGVSDEEIKSARFVLKSEGQYPVNGDFNLATSQWSNLEYSEASFQWDGVREQSICLIPYGGKDFILAVEIELPEGKVFYCEKQIGSASSADERVRIESHVSEMGVEIRCLPWREVQQQVTLF